MWQQVYQHGAAQRQSETLQRFLNGTCLYLAELDRTAVKPWRICRVYTQAGGERSFPVWKLTSPVTKCLPSGEKDRAVICFLLIREEESKVWGWLVKINGKPIQRMLFVHWKLSESWSCFPIRVAFLQLLMTGFIILMWCVPLLSAECWVCFFNSPGCDNVVLFVLLGVQQDDHAPARWSKHSKCALSPLWADS